MGHDSLLARYEFQDKTIQKKVEIDTPMKKFKLSSTEESLTILNNDIFQCQFNALLPKIGFILLCIAALSTSYLHGYVDLDI